MKNYRDRLKQFAVVTGIISGGIGGNGAITPANALTFNFSPATVTDPVTKITTTRVIPTEVSNGFKQAGDLWSSLLTDNYHVNTNFTNELISIRLVLRRAIF